MLSFSVGNESHSDAVESLLRTIESGERKNCVHLNVRRSGLTCPTFEPECARRSFRLHYQRYVCPAECLHFVDRDAALQQAQRDHLKQSLFARAKTLICLPFSLIALIYREFKSFHQSLQVVLLLVLFFLLVIFLAPGLMPHVLELIRALRGS